VYKILLLLFNEVDISFFADIKFYQIQNLIFGKKIVIQKGCIINADGNSKISIGNNVLIQENTYLLNYNGKGITIGSKTNINKNCILYGHGGLNIGDNCLIAAKCVFIPTNHNFSDPTRNINEQGETRKGIVIGNNVWIGAGVTILDGVKIGDNSIIGAGSVVTKSIPSNTISIGIPANVIKIRGIDNDFESIEKNKEYTN